jgi:hypothetical protein
MSLIAMLDDATSRALARFVRSTEENMKLLPTYLRQGESVSARAKAAHQRDAPEAQATQIGRALQELNIEWASTNLPEWSGTADLPGSRWKRMGVRWRCILAVFQ